MEINWTVDDGYMGGARPQITDIDDNFILEDCDDLEEALGYIEEIVNEDFESKIGWEYNNYDKIKSELQKLFENKEKINEENTI